MPKRDIIVIGGSAGSFDVLRTIVAGLPSGLEATVFGVMHLRSRGPSFLAESLAGVTSLPVIQTQQDQPVERGKIYVAPPDRHLVVAANHVHMTRSPKEGLHRPSINVTFRSAANYGPRVIGVLLSGMLDDGAAGLWEIARQGGITVVQDPEEAPFPSMPLSALEEAPVCYRVRAAEIAPLLLDLVAGREVPPMLKTRYINETQPDRFRGFTCPECRGPLYEHHLQPVEFRCRVGHAFPLGTLLDESASTRERKLYEAIVALEEGADLAEYAAARGSGGQNEELVREAKQLREQAATLRKLVEERTAAVE